MVSCLSNRISAWRWWRLEWVRSRIRVEDDTALYCVESAAVM
jgi:hypothetical protein